MGVLSACLPTLRPLVARILPSTVDTTAYAGHQGSNPHSGSWRGNTHGGVSLNDVPKRSESSASTRNLTDDATRDVELGDKHHRQGSRTMSSLGYHVSVTGGGDRRYDANGAAMV